SVATAQSLEPEVWSETVPCMELRRATREGGSSAPDGACASSGRTTTVGPEGALAPAVAPHALFPFGSVATSAPFTHSSTASLDADAISRDSFAFRRRGDRSWLPTAFHSSDTAWLPSFLMRKRSPHWYPKATCTAGACWAPSAADAVTIKASAMRREREKVVMTKSTPHM